MRGEQYLKHFPNGLHFGFAHSKPYISNFQAAKPPLMKPIDDSDETPYLDRFVQSSGMHSVLHSRGQNPGASSLSASGHCSQVQTSSVMRDEGVSSGMKQVES